PGEGSRAGAGGRTAIPQDSSARERCGISRVLRVASNRRADTVVNAEAGDAEEHRQEKRRQYDDLSALAGAGPPSKQRTKNGEQEGRDDRRHVHLRRSQKN